MRHWKPAATGGEIHVEPKADWAARVGRSPDKADAVSMAVAQLAGEEEARMSHELSAFSRVHAVF